MVFSSFSVYNLKICAITNQCAVRPVKSGSALNL